MLEGCDPAASYIQGAQARDDLETAMGNGLRLALVGAALRLVVSLAIQSPRRCPRSELDALAAAGTLESTLGELIGLGR